MKTIKTLAFAAAALFLVASCEKPAPVSDAVVGFETDANEYVIEAGPNFEVPISVTGSNIAYPFTITVNSLPETEENGYSERNVDYRFIEREIVVESAQDKPVVVVRVINSEIESLKMGIEIKAVSNGTISTTTTEVYAQPAAYYLAGEYTAAGLNNGQAYAETWVFDAYDVNTIELWGILGMTPENNASYGVMGVSSYDPESENTIANIVFGIENFVAMSMSGSSLILYSPMVADLSTQSLYNNVPVDFVYKDGAMTVAFPSALAKPAIVMAKINYLTNSLMGTSAPFEVASLTAGPAPAPSAAAPASVEFVKDANIVKNYLPKKDVQMTVVGKL